MRIKFFKTDFFFFLILWNFLKLFNLFLNERFLKIPRDKFKKRVTSSNYNTILVL